MKVLVSIIAGLAIAVCFVSHLADRDDPAGFTWVANGDRTASIWVGKSGRWTRECYVRVGDERVPFRALSYQHARNIARRIIRRHNENRSK